MRLSIVKIKIKQTITKSMDVNGIPHATLSVLKHNIILCYNVDVSLGLNVTMLPPSSWFLGFALSHNRAKLSRGRLQKKGVHEKLTLIC